MPHNGHTAPWTREEIAIVKENYRTLTDEKLAELLPRRTAIGVMYIRYKLGLKKRKNIVPHNKYTCPWTEEEIEILQKNYSIMTDEELTALLPKRTPEGIRYKRSKLGLRKTKKERWTPQEKEILQKAYYKARSCKTLLPNRSLDSIYHQARLLNLNREYGDHVKIKVVRRLSDFERGWIAGLIDGEGSITINAEKRSHRYSLGFSLRPNVSIANKNLELLKEVQYVIGDGIITENQNSKGHKCYHWSLNGLFVIKSLLKQILPDLIVKRPLAELVLDFCNSRINNLKGKAKAPYTAREIDIVRKVIELNKKGGKVRYAVRLG